jgi:hypothetical protein
LGPVSENASRRPGNGSLSHRGGSGQLGSTEELTPSIFTRQGDLHTRILAARFVMAGLPICVQFSIPLRIAITGRVAHLQRVKSLCLQNVAKLPNVAIIGVVSTVPIAVVLACVLTASSAWAGCWYLMEPPSMAEMAWGFGSSLSAEFARQEFVWGKGCETLARVSDSGAPIWTWRQGGEPRELLEDCESALIRNEDDSWRARSPDRLDAKVTPLRPLFGSSQEP